MNVRYLTSIHYKKNCFWTSNAHLFWHSSCKDMPPSWWSIIANYSLPRRLRPKEDALHVFCHRRSQDPGIPKLADVFCLYVFVLVFCAFLFCYRICTFLFVFWHIFHLRWFQDLGIPKLVVVIPKAAPHKQQLVVTNISWATGVFQTKYRSVLNKFKKSQNSYYSVLFGELVPKPVIISKLSRKRGFEQVPSPETIHIVTVNYNTWEQLGSQIELGVGATVTLADRWLTKLSWFLPSSCWEVHLPSRR